jgi:hypothetical protein
MTAFVQEAASSFFSPLSEAHKRAFACFDMICKFILPLMLPGRQYLLHLIRKSDMPAVLQIILPMQTGHESA